jgi:hypothetical protein
MKETQEALIAVNEVALTVCERLKDGFQAGEDIALVFAKFSTDSAFMAKLKAGMDNIGAVPGEIKSITLQDTLELATIQISYIPKFVAALKK